MNEIPSDVPRLTAAMMRASMLVRVSRRDDAAAAPGLEPGHFELLDALDRGPTRISALAEQQRLEVSTVSRRISRLVDLGLVVKAAEPGDRRVQVAELTTNGRATRARVQEQRERTVGRIVEQWEPEDRASLRRLLEKMADGLEGGALAG